MAACSLAGKLQVLQKKQVNFGGKNKGFK